MRSTLSHNAVILLYHRVADPCSDPWALSVTPNHFHEHLDVLLRHGPVMPLADLARAFRAGQLPRRSVAVTFDDGYVDNLHQAAPMLEDHGIPATIFVATGGFIAQEFWWDQLDRLLLQNAEPLPGCLQLSVAGRSCAWKLDDSRLPGPGHGHWRAWDPPTCRRHELFLSLYELLQPLPTADRNSVLEQLRAWAGPERMEWSAHRSMTPEELRSLVDNSMIDVAPHTETHTLLASLPASQQREEIVRSKNAIEDLTGRRASVFAYPFGRPGDYTGETIEIVREVGFTIACANFPGGVRPSTNPYEWPRMYVQDCDGAEFERRLSRWLRG